MTTTTQELEDMRLPDLWHLFRQVRGESTRCPNRPYLIRVIREGLRSAPVIALPESAPEPASTANAEASEAAESDAPSDPPSAEDGADAATPEGDESDVDGDGDGDGDAGASPGAEGTERGRLVSMTVDELQMKYFEVVGRPTASEDKAYVEPANMGSREHGVHVLPGTSVEGAPHIPDAIAPNGVEFSEIGSVYGDERPGVALARRATMTMTDLNKETLEALRLPELQEKYAAVVGETTRCPNKAWLVRKVLEVTVRARSTPPAHAGSASTRTMTVEELQARHLELIGRPTGSVDVPYLRWRLRQAERGHIGVGRAPRGTREADDNRVLPLRMSSRVVEQMDEARRRLGLASRAELFRRALHRYFVESGEHEVADFLLLRGDGGTGAGAAPMSEARS